MEGKEKRFGVSVRKLWWLTTRLLGYRARPGIASSQEKGALLYRSKLSIASIPKEVILERLSYCSEGHRVTGFSLRPRSAEGPLPTILYFRGGLGPHGVLEEEDFTFLGDLAAQGNFQILASQYRGNDGGEGEDQAGLAEALDVFPLLDIFHQKELADRRRVALLGFSRGGSMALMAHRHGITPRAIITIGCISNLEAAFEKGSWLLRSAIRISTGGAPSAKTQTAYFDRSPLFWVDAIRVPLLLLRGEADEVIDPEQCHIFLKALKKAGKDCELETFAGGNHKLLTHPRERLEAVLRFLRKQRLHQLAPPTPQ